MLLEGGAKKVGFATLETIKSDITGTDLTYLLPEAQSAVEFFVPFIIHNFHFGVNFE